jgi:alpha-beta hydrolase superfamily lysophospholipase
VVEEYFTTIDNIKIFYRQNMFDKASASLVLIHGLGEHSGRYIYLFNKFSNKFNMFAMDLRGHGRSGGKRGHILSFQSI